MKVLFALGAADIKETKNGIKSVVKTLGLVEGVKAINYASGKHFADIIRGEGNYPETGKKRIWFKLNYLKHLYEYLKRKDSSTANQKIAEIIKAPTLQFIGQMIPDARLFTKEFMLNHVWQHLVDHDYNVEGSVMSPKGNSVSLNVKRCFYNEVARDVGLMAIADRMCYGDYVFWETYHPNVRFSRTKTLIDGDDYCDHTLTWVE
ncbi:MAG: L-2-amino-thiazoline-4-carboxylic acid hydrolase [Desulfobacteraceae bacterium]|nr:L-2-amino-thiazoline-4-carboxylic acid hydrolase [Desulfobacteraceae bacterium]MBC2755544.1 L-2-amino-thiazoline-4-carboxylic acid hydrolase [Desulfobacteraceae bacterium]